MKVLVIEDEPAVISFLRRGLIEANHEVVVALDGLTGWELLQIDTPDVILLDLMLPAMNGMELCRKIRKDQIQTPIIMLTALGTSENIVGGLEAGADDYLVKPFKVSELLARMTAVTRRAHGSNSTAHLLSINNLNIDLRGKAVTRGEKKVNLTATEFNLLEFLVRNKGKVFSRAEILERVWDINHDMTTNVVDVYINYLRKKIDQAGDRKLIHTVVGMGYVLREG